MQNKSFLSLLITVMLLASSVHADDIYKWTDEDGKTHFGSKPPLNDKAVKLKIEPINSVKSPKQTATSLATDKDIVTKSTIPSQKFTSYYKNNRKKYYYETQNGNRVNPTYEYYNNGDLKQKWVYPANLLEEPIQVNGLLTISNISIVKEHRDSLKLKISYELFSNNKKSWLHFSPNPAKYFNKKNNLRLKHGKNTGEITKTLSLESPSSWQSDNLKFMFFDGTKREWITIGHVSLIKVWIKNY